jgi:NAD(P)-dependent dehydrogenase (short-subunit alcohol dehydrogenase family)
MKRREYGRIVNISSASGKRSVPRRSPYTASKSGLLGLTRTLAVEGGEYDVNANAVCPGTVAGPRIDRVIEREAEATGRTTEEVAAEKRAKSPRGEFVQPEDVAETVAFLCSTSADRITGQSVNVSAGKVTY